MFLCLASSAAAVPATGRRGELTLRTETTIPC
jgi:hypothetical protein